MSRNLLLLLLAASMGCGSLLNGTRDFAKEASTRAKELGILLADAPAKAMSVQDARESAKDGEEIFITGRIGGDADPWVNGRAAFQIVDSSLIPCNERKHGGCPTPWDYCCSRNELPKAVATIKFLDKAGNTISTDAREWLGVKELLRITVEGQAKRDESGNLTVIAHAVHFSQ